MTFGIRLWCTRRSVRDYGFFFWLLERIFMEIYSGVNGIFFTGGVNPGFFPLPRNVINQTAAAAFAPATAKPGA